MSEDQDQGAARPYQALCGVIVPVLTLLSVLVGGWLWDGYSHRTQVISDLGGAQAPYPLVQNVSFLIVGLLIVVFAVGLRRGLDHGRGARLGPALVGVFGLAWAAMAVLPCTAIMCDGEAAIDALHLLVINVGLLAFAFATLLLWRGIRRRPDWRGLSGYTALTGIATLVLMVATLIAGSVDPEALYIGVVQRVKAAVVLVWIGVVGLRLLYGARTSTQAPRQST